MNVNRGATIYYTKSAGTEVYRIEKSHDGGETWSAVGLTPLTEFTQKELQNGEKIHICVFAVNAEHKSEPSGDYPIYVRMRHISRRMV
ncbi:fibronectin type III domain-containing protein [Paenibacillus sp. N3.4]|uniref:fibronectin type III domain-containing protein n=1 Tax=Paenibacillus sp. N3.4 TaxID=2603222 RepID=UPI0011CB8DCC|nr:fibronectin type III domain-containing protein [Paenibacillus sp. N3.4]TXK85560.1 fibronectin type III domain-containing protein [Paenibacillus sp. N3.4]